MTERQIATLLKRMSLREKIGQLCLLSGTADENKALIRKGRVGSLANVVGAETVNEFQHIAVEESRLGIPLLFGRDVIHGFRTIFPIPLGQAAAWNPPLVEDAARIAAAEASAAGIRWTFAPMVDVARDPRWGRIAESGGEDPFLVGQMGAAMVRGFQGLDLGDPTRIAACAKHFAAYGAAEAGRDYNTVDVSELTMRDVYLPPFKACVDAGVATFMSAFNEISGIPASGNPMTLRQVLRKEWGFDGFVVSDSNSVAELITHGFCADAGAAAETGLKAGVDMEIVSTCYADHLESLIRRRRVPLATLNAAVRAILRLKARLGLFENPYTAPARASCSLAPEHLAVARRLASQSLVLLQNNDGVLPLRKKLKALAVIGPLADAPDEQVGCSCMDARTDDQRTPLAAIREAVSSATTVNYASGLPSAVSDDTTGFDEAVRFVRESDVAVLFLGESAWLSGEAHSRAFLDLPGAQQALLDAVAATGKPVIVVLMAGRPLTIAPVLRAAQAVLYAWHPGSMGGPAIADVIFGDAVPTGRTPVSFPRTVGQIPVYYNHKQTGHPPISAARSAPMGTPLNPTGFYFYAQYLDVESTPLFPFGFGLSYTTFAYTDLKVATKKVKRGGTLRVSVRLTNTGSRAGEEVVQLYVRDLVGSVTRPVKELKGFRRVALAAGESREVVFELPTTALSFTTAALRRVVEPGQFHVWLAPDAASGEPGAFEIV